MVYNPGVIRGTRDFLMEVARGNVQGMSTVGTRGHLPDFDAGDGFVDIAAGGDLTYLTTAEIMKIASTSTDDDGDPIGTGLRTLIIIGVDNDGAAIQEVITMNGTTDVLTTKSYLRVNFLVGLKTGSVGWNVGDITATASAAATVQTQMGATEGISQSSHYTVPLGKTLHLYQLEFNVVKQAGGTAPVCEFIILVRPGGDGNAFLQLFTKSIDAANINALDVILPFPSSDTQAIARTDFRFRANTDQNTTEVRTRMYGILVDDKEEF